MKDLSAQMAELQITTQMTRLKFLQIEVETCYAAIDFGKHELELGRSHLAQKEANEAAKGIETLVRFLPELDDAGQRDVLQIQIDDLRRSLGAFQQSLHPPATSGSPISPRAEAAE